MTGNTLCIDHFPTANCKCDFLLLKVGGETSTHLSLNISDRSTLNFLTETIEVRARKCLWRNSPAESSRSKVPAFTNFQKLKQKMAVLLSKFSISSSHIHAQICHKSWFLDPRRTQSVVSTAAHTTRWFAAHPARPMMSLSILGQILQPSCSGTALG